MEKRKGGKGEGSRKSGRALKDRQYNRVYLAFHYISLQDIERL